jgi:hypothetical protein
MAKAVKHTVTFPDGTTQVRRSPRIYTHAVIARGNVERQRKEAHEYVPSRIDFDWYAGIAATGKWRFRHLEDVVADAKLLADAKANVEGGWDGYVARERQRRIDNFERALAKGEYGWRAVRWSQSARAVQKAAQDFAANHTYLTDVRVVEVARAE